VLRLGHCRYGLLGGNDTTAPHLDVRPPHISDESYKPAGGPGMPAAHLQAVPRLKQDGFDP
jgi:hypothetical protein